MSIYEPYSKRVQKAERIGQQDVYQYTDVPQAFRVQVVHLWEDTLTTSNTDYYEFINKMLSREYGLFALTDIGLPAYDQCRQFILQANIPGVLDIVELSFRIIERALPKNEDFDEGKMRVTAKGKEAVAELNYRFKEHGMGYQYEEGEIIRVDSQYLHAEAVKPAIALLIEAGFEGALDEFMQAHEHYRHGDYKDAINNALKAFESTMKAICAQRRWTPPANPQARHLIETIITNGLISTEMQAYFNGLRPVLESGLPTLRNRTSAHGQGETPVVIPGYLAAYALHLAAANIVMLVEAHKAMP